MKAQILKNAEKGFSFVCSTKGWLIRFDRWRMIPSPSLCSNTETYTLRISVEPSLYMYVVYFFAHQIRTE